MPITDRNLTPGTILTARYKKQVFTCTLVPTDDGPRYELEDGKRFKSPSAAGSQVMNGTACNGWAFWSLKGDEPEISRRMREYEGFVTAVKRGQAGKLVPSDGETSASVRLRAARAASRRGKPIQTWTVEDTVYFKPF
jgi:Restriction Enzyme Adenine Methylase Associated